MLFTGDVSNEGEQAVIDNPDLAQCDVLKAAHHGSKYTNSEDLLSIVKPAYTVISAAKDNDYAIIELESAPNVGYFGWSTSATSGQSIKIMGYPSYLVNDPPSGTSQIIKQYYDTGTINAAYTGYIRTTNTNTNGGSSGGPVLNSSDKVIAIVKSHTSSANIATRVDSYAAEWFSSFR